MVAVRRWRVGRCWQWLVQVLALLLVLQVGIGLVGVPRGVRDWISATDIRLEEPPDVIVVLGGGGIPSATGLMRTFYGAHFAQHYAAARVVVALPADADPEVASVGRMKRELVMRGVAAERILMAAKGNNTHQQAREVYGLLGAGAGELAVLVVTSPTHTRRSILCFQRAGFRRVGGCHAAEVFAEADLDAGFGGADYLGMGLGLRYGFWNRLQYTIELGREFLALLHYRQRGWI